MASGSNVHIFTSRRQSYGTLWAATRQNGVSHSVGADITDPNNPQQNHNEMPCVIASERVASRCATPKGVVGAVASATEYNTLSDGTPAAVKHERLAGATATAAAKDASTGPMETGDVPADVLLECCMNAVLNVPMEKQTKDAANGADEGDAREVTVLDEEVTHQLRLV